MENDTFTTDVTTVYHNLAVCKRGKKDEW